MIHPVIYIKDFSRLPLNQRRQLPRISGVYAVLAGRKILYIGRATNLCERFRIHEHLCDFERVGGDSVAWMEVPNFYERYRLERVLVRHPRPALNVYQFKYIARRQQESA